MAKTMFSLNNPYNLIMVSILVTGFWFPKIGIPFIFLLLLFLIFFKKNNVRVSRLFIFQYMLVLVFTTIYIAFWDDPFIPINASYFKNKEIFMLIQLFTIFTSVYWIVLFVKKQEQLINLLYLFSLGMFLKSLLITLYTLVNAPYLLAMRELLDPISMKISNSPGISLMAVFGTLFSLYFLFVGGKKMFVFHFTVLISGLFIAILLQARTFFVIFTIFLLYMLILKLNFKNLLKAFLIAPILIIGIFWINDYMIENNSYYAQTQENTLKRFEHEGVESRRYEQWESAINIIFENPFGGNSTDKSIEKTYWFHNLWLDIGRTSGVAPIILILIFQLTVLFMLVKSLCAAFTFDKHFLLIFYISLLIGLFVEVTLEGNIVLFVFHIFFNALILRYLQLDKKRRKHAKYT